MSRAKQLSRLLATVILTVPGLVQADVITDWNATALASVAAATQLPPDGARTMAMVHVAMFDAVNTVVGRFTPYSFRGPAPDGASAEAAAASAARSILVALFPDQRAALEDAFVASLARIPDGPGRTSGIALGQEVAGSVLALRSHDGSGTQVDCRPSALPGVYVPTVLPLSPEWATVKPWVMERSAEFRPGRPPDLKGAEWARDYNEIQRIGAKQSSRRTREQTDVARFWAITGPSTWNPPVVSLVESGQLSLVERARVFALVNIAATDAFIAVFDAKYAYNFWRPITAIRNGDTDDNDATVRDAGWLPLIETPLHPEYPCAHCITSAAVAAVLEAQFGAGAVPPITMTSPTAPGVTRRWGRISEYVTEVSNARVWGGVHYRNSALVGREMGRAIGTLTVNTCLTRPR